MALPASATHSVKQAASGEGERERESLRLWL